MAASPADTTATYTEEAATQTCTYYTEEAATQTAQPVTVVRGVVATHNTSPHNLRKPAEDWPTREQDARLCGAHVRQYVNGHRPFAPMPPRWDGYHTREWCVCWPVDRAGIFQSHDAAMTELKRKGNDVTAHAVIYGWASKREAEWKPKKWSRNFW